jgi:hypothetical protein
MSLLPGQASIHLSSGVSASISNRRARLLNFTIAVSGPLPAMIEVYSRLS